MRRQRMQHRTSCKLCGGTINQLPTVSLGYCGKCRDRILKKWSKVSFEDRVFVLKKMGVDIND